MYIKWIIQSNILTHRNLYFRQSVSKPHPKPNIVTLQKEKLSLSAQMVKEPHPVVEASEAAAQVKALRVGKHAETPTDARGALPRL